MNNVIAKISVLTRKQRLALLLILGLLVLLYISLKNVGKKQEIRPRAAGSGEVDLRFDPSSGTKAKNETFKIDLKVFKTASRSINSSGAQAVINIDTKFTINSATCEAPFNGLPIANISGSTVTFICGTALGDPVVLDAAGKSFASVNVTVKSDAADGAAPLTFTSTRVTEAGVGGQAPDVSTVGQNASITIGTVAVSPTPSPSPTVVATETPTPTLTPTLTPTGTLVPTVTPTPTIVIIETLTPTPTGIIVVSETPTPTLTPTGTLVPTATLTPTGTLVPTVTPTPTPPSGQEAYIIDIGTKAVLGINIGAGTTPQIKFTTKLAGAEGHPDLYFRLRAKDDLAFLNNPNAGPTCDSPGVGGVDLYIPMKSDNSGIYTPVTGINISAPAGAVVAPVSADGWVSLTGLSGGKYYTLNLKGPKTRGTKMIEHVLLAGGQSASQNYDWTGSNLQLQPGDLPDPNNSNKQDCTVNSVDISLINSRLGKTDPDSLNIADVSYDGVVNANDIAQVVGTLSTKPDDDN